MSAPDLKQTILAQLASRHGVDVPPDLDIGAYGDHPRLGSILDSIMARSKTVLPRHLQDQNSITIGPYDFIAADSILRRDNTDIRLTEKERDILLTLLDAGGAAITRKDLLDRVWGYASGVETHTLETHIYRLRQKIEPDPAHPTLLLTCDDGYILSP